MSKEIEKINKETSEDITGKRFGRLVAIRLHSELSRDRRYQWVCQCDCGNIKIVTGRNLRKGVTRSCGCIIKRNYDTKSRIYHEWIGMRGRCNNEKHHAYNNYGGRGIRVYDEWEKSFEAFYEWSMDNGYADDLTIERVDVDKGYEPSNCKWIPKDEQSKNKRSSRKITIDGVTKILADWDREKGFSPGTVRNRLVRGWSEYDAVMQPKDENWRCTKEADEDCEKIIDYIHNNGGITSKEAEEKLKLKNFYACISRMEKQGMQIYKEYEYNDNHGFMRRHKIYRLEKK